MEGLKSEGGGQSCRRFPEESGLLEGNLKTPALKYHAAHDARRGGGGGVKPVCDIFADIKVLVATEIRPHHSTLRVLFLLIYCETRNLAPGTSDEPGRRLSNFP